MHHSGVYLSVVSEVIERVRGGVCAYVCCAAVAQHDGGRGGAVRICATILLSRDCNV